MWWLNIVRTTPTFATSVSITIRPSQTSSTKMIKPVLTPTKVTKKRMMQVSWGDNRKLTLEKKCTNATNATLYLFGQTIWGDSWKKRTSATICDFPSIQAGDFRKHLKTPLGEMQPFVTLHLFMQAIWENIWKLPQVKKCKNATNATLHLFGQTIWGDSRKKRTSATICDFPSFHFRKHLKTPLGEKAYKCNLCDFASVRADNLRRRLKKTYKCNQWDFTSFWADNLRRQLKKAYKCNHLWLPICSGRRF